MLVFRKGVEGRCFCIDCGPEASSYGRGIRMLLTLHDAQHEGSEQRSKEQDDGRGNAPGHSLVATHGGVNGHVSAIRVSIRQG